jgi:hypothetical protein
VLDVASRFHPRQSEPWRQSGHRLEHFGRQSAPPRRPCQHVSGLGATGRLEAQARAPDEGISFHDEVGAAPFFLPLGLALPQEGQRVVEAAVDGPPEVPGHLGVAGPTHKDRFRVAVLRRYGLAVVVGIMVGSGIFRTPGTVAALLGRPGLMFGRKDSYAGLRGPRWV